MFVSCSSVNNLNGGEFRENFYSIIQSIPYVKTELNAAFSRQSLPYFLKALFSSCCVW